MSKHGFKRIKKSRSLADVRVANVLKRVVQGLSIHCEELQELHKAMSKVVMTHEQFANLRLECYLETKEEYDAKTRLY
jgi:hypothetical protein